MEKDNNKSARLPTEIGEKDSTPDRACLTKIINDEILGYLSLKHRNSFLRSNLAIMLEPDEMNFLKEVQDFCEQYEKKVDHTEEVYDYMPDFGEKGYISRVHSFEDIDMAQKPYGLTADFIRHFAIDFFDCQLSWSIDASVLCLNPIYAHHEGDSYRINAVKELSLGKAVGCVCITEPERGSDATHQLTVSKRTEEGLIINGIKAFNTNAPKSKYAIVYATEEPNNPRTMTQSLVEFPDDNIDIRRIYIPGAPRVYLGKETFKNYLVPKERIMGDVGKGKEHMFEGLVPERIGIAMLNVCESWNALTHAAIYSSLREQMGKPIINHQGVGFLLTDIWAKTTNLTRAMLNFCRTYDKLMEKHKGNIPGSIMKGLVTASSQLKYDCAKENANNVYECMNLMGGAGVCDNTMMWELLGVSRLQEIVGGARQIQQYIMNGALKALFKKEKDNA